MKMSMCQEECVILSGEPKVRSRRISLIAFLLFAFALSACTFYDNFESDRMLDATASIEDGSSSSKDVEPAEKSSSSKEISSSGEETKSSSSGKADSSNSTESSSGEKSSSSEAPASSAKEESSSSMEKSSSSAAPSFVCGDSTMSRGGVEYATVEINHLCWTKKNLSFKPSASDGYLCYGGDEENCEKYGYLYDFETAKTLCPSGWRLPTQEDLQNLLDYSDDYEEFAGSYLKAAEGWEGDPGNGNDELGFTALPGGSCNEEKSCSGLGTVGIWWTSTEKARTAQYVLKLTGDEDAFYAESNMQKTYYGSVRCVRK